MDTAPPPIDSGEDLFTPGPVVDTAPPPADDTTPIDRTVDRGSDDTVIVLPPEGPVEAPPADDTAPIEIEPEQPLPQYRYSPYVPRDFQYVVPEFARNFGPFAGFAPGLSAEALPIRN